MSTTAVPGTIESPVHGGTAADARVHVGLDATLFEIMETTRAMRRLSPDPVPDELLRSIVEAATWAPTGGNAQAESFIVVTDRGTIARLTPLWHRVVDDYHEMFLATMRGRPVDAATTRMRAAIEYQRDHFAETPAVIVACYDYLAIHRSRRDWRAVRQLVRAVGVRRAVRLSRATPTLMQRSEAGCIYPAVQNLLLAARAHGLAACMTTWHLLAEREFKKVRCSAFPPASTRSRSSPWAGRSASSDQWVDVQPTTCST